MTKTLNQITDQLNGSEILDPVHSEPLFLEGGLQVPGKKAIINSNSGKIVSVVGERYKIVQTAEVIERFANSIDESNLNTNGLVVTSSTSPNAVRTIAKFQFPEHSIDLRKDDKTDLQICLRNSHDGTWPIRADVGGFRMACANGQVIGDFIAAYKAFHTKSMSYAGLGEGLDNSINMFEQAGERWIEYRKKKINKEQGENVVLDYLGKVYETTEERAAILDRKSERRDGMLDSLGDYGKDMGWNLLAAYNTLTDDASHNKEDALVQFDRGRRASMVIESHYEQLAA